MLWIESAAQELSKQPKCCHLVLQLTANIQHATNSTKLRALALPVLVLGLKRTSSAAERSHVIERPCDRPRVQVTILATAAHANVAIVHINT